MSTVSNVASPSGTRRLAAAAAVVAVLARVASILLWPQDSDAGHEKMLATADVHHGLWTAATAAETVAWVAAACAVFPTLALVTGRGWLLARLGGTVYGAGLVVLGLVGGAMNSVTGVLAQEPNRALMVQVQGDLHSPVLNAFVALIMLGNLMVIVFAVGLARAGLFGWWFVATTVVAVVAYVLTSDSGDHLVVLASFLPLGATWLGLAWRLASARPLPRTLSEEPLPTLV